MTISSTTNRKEYTGNGVTTAFAFPYPFEASADLRVFERTIATGAIVEKTAGTHFTVTGAGDPSGGTVTATTAPANTVNWIIVRDPARTQGVALVNGEKIDVEASINDPLDALTLMVQRQNDRADRSIHAPDGDLAANANMEMPNASTRAGYGLAFDANGLPVRSTKTDAATAAAVDLFSSFIAAANIPPSTIQFDTVAAMVAFSVPASLNGMLVYARGRNAVGDGGQGFFRVTTTNPGSEDGGTIFNSGTPGYYFVRQYDGKTLHEAWFGVTRDGTTGDAAAMLAAMSSVSGATLQFGAGSSLVDVPTPQFVIPAADTAFQGAGRNATVNAFSATTNGYPNIFTMSYANLTLRDMKMSYSSPATYGGSGVQWSADNLTLENVEFDGTMTDTGSARSYNIVPVYCDPTATVKNLTITRSVIHAVNESVAKNNSNTGVQSGIREFFNEYYGNYLGDNGLNSPNGSNTNHICAFNNHHDPKAISEFSGQAYPLGTQFASVEQARILFNRYAGSYYDAIHLEENVNKFQVIGNIAKVSTNGLTLRPGNFNTAGTWYWPKHGVVCNNIFEQSGTPLTTIRAGLPNYGIGLHSGSLGAGFTSGENLNIHDNLIVGSGFGAGIFLSGDYHDGPGRIRLHHNTVVQSAIGIYVPDNSFNGGIEIESNTTDGCPVHIKGAMLQIQSHNFKNLDPAASTSVPLRGVNATFNFITIRKSNFSFAPVSIAASASADFALFRLGANDRMGATLTAIAAANGNSRVGSCMYQSVAWDGSSAPTFTLFAGEAAHSITVTMSKKTISGTDYLVATVTNSSGSTQAISLTATVEGLYSYYGT